MDRSFLLFEHLPHLQWVKHTSSLKLMLGIKYIVLLRQNIIHSRRIEDRKGVILMMMKGLYEAHLPVSDLKTSIAFYEKLELTLAHENERVAFYGLRKERAGLTVESRYKCLSIPSFDSARCLSNYNVQYRTD